MYNIDNYVVVLVSKITDVLLADSFGQCFKQKRISNYIFNYIHLKFRLFWKRMDYIGGSRIEKNKLPVKNTVSIKY